MIVAQIHPQLQRLAVPDLVVLLFIDAAGISGLRWSTHGVSDIDALRAEFRRREWEVRR